MNSDKQRLLNTIKDIHFGCFKLCKQAYGKYLPIAGNVGVFCQSEEDYESFLSVERDLVKPSDNPNQKYFELKQPITISASNEIPEATYTWLYIRKPADDSPEAGDIDFILNPNKYMEFKAQVAYDKVKHTSVYERPGWDMIEVRNPNIDAIAYITTKEMAEKVRVRF